jgi:hypothetical protein
MISALPDPGGATRTSSVVKITGIPWGGSLQQGIEEAQMLPHEVGTQMYAV